MILDGALAAAGDEIICSIPASRLVDRILDQRPVDGTGNICWGSPWSRKETCRYRKTALRTGFIQSVPCTGLTWATRSHLIRVKPCAATESGRPEGYGLNVNTTSARRSIMGADRAYPFSLTAPFSSMQLQKPFRKVVRENSASAISSRCNRASSGR